MNAEKYDYTTDNHKLIYVFFSIGKKGIIPKMVIFEKIAPNHFNLAFGDYDTNANELNDVAVSNNGDTIKVLATVIQTIKDFFEAYPFALLDIQGSTATRTKLYQKIMRDNISTIEEEYRILGFLSEDEKPQYPNFELLYQFFQISKR